MQPLKWMFVALLLVSNCGFWLFCFNQINATGLPRRVVKTGTKLFVSICFGLPVFIAWFEFTPLLEWLNTSAGFRIEELWPARAPLFCSYGAWCLASGLILGACFLESRLWLKPAEQLLSEECQDFSLRREMQYESSSDALTRWASRLPGNQIEEIRVNKKRLQVERTVPGLGELRIGHISDLHMTGRFHADHYRFVLDKFLELQPNIIFIAGDIVDYDHCLPWIEKILHPLEAEYGTFFVLGNHDLRVNDQQTLLASLTNLDFIDLGSKDHRVKLESGSVLKLVGNEQPWYERHEVSNALPEESRQVASEDSFRIGLSHSPDQLRWAREEAVDLLLAGHTHGGQIRVPFLGPLVSPSHFGSRYASGVFYREPTLMHVSRGISGTHPFRWRCRPEVSVLTLTTGEA